MELEIAVQDAAGAVIARDGGADRVELCSALELGGITPSAGLIARVLAAVGPAFPVHVLVRPRPGDFCYDADELTVSVEDVRRAVAAGAAGVVVGQLRRTRSGLAVDSGALESLIDAAGGARVTFHRAFDLVEDVEAALEVLLNYGAGRILSSGRAADAHSGIADLERLVGLADGRIEVMAGGGVRIPDLSQIVRSGVDAIHLSAKRTRRVQGGYALGAGTRDGAMTWYETDPALVASAAAAVAAGQPYN